MFQENPEGKQGPGALEVKWSPEKEITEAPELGEEEKYNLQQKMEAMDKILADTKKAKFKIELMFGTERSMSEPTPGALSFWESGSKLHGGGDAKIYLCPGRRLKHNDCEAFIPFAFNAYGHLVCPSCRSVWKGTQVIGEIMGRHSMRQWSELIYLYFRKLEHNCDLYLKHAPNDIRSRALQEQEKQKGGDLLAVARKRALHVYPLRNIVKDTSAGADILKRFYAFLVS